MKKLSLLFAALVSGALFGADLITPESFLANYKKCFKRPGFSLQKNVVKIQALPPGKWSPEEYKKRNSGQQLIYSIKNLKAEEIPGATFKLDFEAKITKLSGQVEVCVRVVKNDGQSWGYPGVTFRKWAKVPEWKKFSKTFKAPKNAKALQFYIWARYLGAEDEVQVRNIKVSKIK